MASVLNESLPQNFTNLLNDTIKIKDVAPKWPRIVIARSNESISTVFKTLIDNKIQSVPLLDVEKNKYVAFIDIFDILSYVVEVLNLSSTSDDSWMMSTQFQNTTCVVLSNRSNRDPWQVIKGDSPISLAISKLSISGVHRLAVFDDFGKFSSIITQSRIVRYISNRQAELGDFGKEEIGKLSVIKENIINISENEKLIEAFLTLYGHNISGVAVVDKDEKIIGNISLSDFKDIGFRIDRFPVLFTKISTFLKYKTEGQNTPKLVWTNRNATLNEVLTQLSNKGVHRIYIVDEQGMESKGIITLTDIMNLFRAVLRSTEFRR